jgi:hypothetical protein
MGTLQYDSTTVQYHTYVALLQHSKKLTTYSYWLKEILLWYHRQQQHSKEF